MHYTLGVIVSAEPGTKQDEIIQKAENAIAGYEGPVWDYYTVEKVLSAKDSEFHNVLNGLIRAQNASYEMVKQSLLSVFKYDERYQKAEEGGLEAYVLLKFAKYCDGDLQSDSFVFDAERYSTLITEKAMAGYNNEPDRFFMVLMDIHN